MSFKVSFWKRPFRLIIAIAVGAYFAPSVALAVNVTADKTISADTTVQQRITADNVTLTIDNNATVELLTESLKSNNGRSGSTFIIESGSSVIASGTSAGNKDKAIRANSNTNLTITNSGTIEAEKSYAIDVNRSVGSVITNNAGGIIKARRMTINGLDAATSNTTITNSGSIYLTEKEEVIQFANATGTTITNNAGGEIYRDIGATGSHPTIQIGPSSSITNSGQIRDDSSIDWALSLDGNTTTVTNNSGGLFGGEIRITASATSAALINSGTIAAQSPSG